MPQKAETNLLCASRGTGRSRLRRTTRYAASYARVALAGRSCGGQVPRSPAFFSPTARKYNKKFIFLFPQKRLKEFFPALFIKRNIPRSLSSDVKEQPSGVFF